MKTTVIFRGFGGPAAEDARELRRILTREIYYKEDKDMKVKEGFVLRDVAGEYILMPVGDNIGRFNGTLLMNEISAFIWEKLQNPVSREDLLKAVLDEYEIDEATAASDLDMLLEKLQGFGVIEEDV